MRTGRLHGITKVLIPYTDVEGKRQFIMVTIGGTIYASKMYAGIKKLVFDTFGVKVDKDWLANVPLISNSADPEVQISEEEKNDIVEAFISRIELKDEEVDYQPATRGEEVNASKTGEPMCTVSDQTD